MTIQSFIAKGVEGGWKNEQAYSFKGDDFVYCISFILLDPEAWRAVGKVEGWTTTEESGGNWDDMRTMSYADIPTWKHNMHTMIDTLAEGRTIEQYLETL